MSGKATRGVIIKNVIAPSMMRLMRRLVPAEELVGGRASTKSMYYKKHTPPKKDEKRKKKDELAWLWFEEASQFEGFNKGE